MNGVRLELLGPPEVLCDGRVVSGIGRKAMGLLAYLAVAKGRFHNRDELANLLWSDRFDEQARQSLRQTLSTLRKALGEAIVSNDQGIALAADKVASDVEQFEALAASADPVAQRQACALYRGEFLEGVQRSAPAFDDWMQAERRRLRDLLLGVLEALAGRELAEGSLDAAIASARRLVAEEPAHEGGHRLIMQVLAQQGQRAAALRQFDACKAALSRHLDAVPEAETVELAERIRSAPDVETVRTKTESPQAAPDATRPRASRSQLIAAGVAALAVLGVAATYLATRAPTDTRSEAQAQCAAAASLPPFVTPAVVVLPFDADDGRGEDAAFADSITERIGDAFSAAPLLTVVTGPPRGHQDLAKPRRELAANLGVTHVLDGSVHIEGNQASVNVRIIGGERGEVLWSTLQTYDLSSANRLAVRDQIARDVVRAVQRELTDGEQALHFAETSSFAVLEHVFTGAEHMSQLSEGNVRRARAEFEAALAIDPRDPPANTGVAWTYAIDVMFGWSEAPATDLARAEEYTRVAARTDPDYFYAKSVLGLVSLLKGEHEAAVAYGEEALRLSGGGADAVALQALVLSYTEDVDRSLELAQRALRLRPYNHPDWYRWILARAARLNGQPRTAIACLPRAELRDSGATAAQVERALALVDAGEINEAQALMKTARRRAGLTAEAYCAHPPYASQALTQRCIDTMTDAGADAR